MSYPPPPGLKSTISSTSAHPSLPARPPPPTGGSSSHFNQSSGSNIPGNSSHGAFTAFKPRTVASRPDGRTASPTISAGPQPSSSYSAPPSSYNASPASYQQQPHTYAQPAYYQQQQQSTDQYPAQQAPQIQNPFPLPGQGGQGGFGRGRDGQSSYDPEMQAQIAQWQSAYMSKDDAGGRAAGTNASSGAGNANLTPLGGRSHTSTPLTNQQVASAANPDSGVAAVVAGADGKQKTVIRSGGGQTWQDSSLLEWDPAHFRLFVGNLAGEVTDDSLLKAFSRYESVQKARVVRDKRTTKSKGYGFVSFSNGDQFFQAAKEMQGKYIGSHPVTLRRSTTEIKAVNPRDKRQHHNGGKGGNKGGHGAGTGAGVSKKPTKTKGGLKILG